MADVVTYNGPSCKSLLLGLGAKESSLMPWNYAANPKKIYRGPIASNSLNDLQATTPDHSARQPEHGLHLLV